MKQDHVIRRMGHSFGTAAVCREGLYYKISCLCPEPCRIRVRSETVEKDLGPCVPVEGGFGLTTRIPSKHLGDGALDFFTEEPKQPEEFCPVSTGMPFAGIEGLRQGRMAVRDGIAGVLFHKEISSPTGQWSEPKTSE